MVDVHQALAERERLALVYLVRYKLSFDDYFGNRYFHRRLWLAVNKIGHDEIGLDDICEKYLDFEASFRLGQLFHQTA